MFRETESPEIYDESISTCSATFDVALDTLSTTIPLPHPVHQASSKRRSEFIAGRLCAQLALEKIDKSFAGLILTQGLNGEPIWPDGYTGSITHCDKFASAAVVPTHAVRSLGIDSEKVFERVEANQVEKLVGIRHELKTLSGALEYEQLISLIFCAKESIYKCLFPLVQAIFDFNDVMIVSIDPVAGAFESRVVSRLNDLIGPGIRMNGRFQFVAEHIHSVAFLNYDQLTLRQ